jgi:lysophospholipase L1-like esterase
LWHLKNGVLGPLKPKVWLILIGTNDLYTSRCTDRFVVANILNVLKMIAEHQPDAQFILHGILPRKDKPDSKTQHLGQVWKRAQAVNIQIRKFCDHKQNIYYMQAGQLFMEETEVRGRQQIDVTKMSDGTHPTKEGLEVWGDYIVKEVTSILHNAAEAKAAAQAAGEQ